MGRRPDLVRGPGGEPWISVACQELGASVWWPTKDTQADEPDSQRVALTVPDSLQALANGRLRGVEQDRGHHVRVVRLRPDQQLRGVGVPAGTRR